MFNACRITGVVLTLVTVVPGGASAQPAFGFYSISGSITMTVPATGRHATPVPDVMVVLRRATDQKELAVVSTGTDGKYRFGGLSADTYIVTPRRQNFVFGPESRSVRAGRPNPREEDFTAAVLVSIAIDAAGGADRELSVGYTQQFLATGTYSDSSTRDLTAAVTWSSANPSVATVAATGVASSLATGTTTIAGTSGAIEGSSVLSVIDPTVECRAACAVPWAATQMLPVGSSCQAAPCTIADTDGDGLNDAWERNGYIDENCNGIFDSGTDLPLPGADPASVDVYLEYDYMAGTHSHAPSTSAIDAIVDGFARRGVNLHVDPAHDAIPERRVVSGLATLDPVCAGADAVRFSDLKTSYFDANRKLAYHYAVFGHFIQCDSPEHCSACPPTGGDITSFGMGGMAELYRNGIAIATGRILDLGYTIPASAEAGLLAHELGHNLGLHHGGDADLPKYKPNYVSLVNNSFLYIGIPVASAIGSPVPASCSATMRCPSGSFCSMFGSAGSCFRIDYSGETLPSLDERNLDETLGVQGSSTDVTAQLCPDYTAAFAAVSGPVDWNCNGWAGDSGFGQDLTGEGERTVLTGFNDWAAMRYAFQCEPAGWSGGAPAVDDARARHVLGPPRPVQIAISTDDAATTTVAVFGADDFDVRDVDLQTVRFAATKPSSIAMRDVNDDGRADLVLSVTGISSGTSGMLSGSLENSQVIVGEGPRPGRIRR